MTHKILSFIYRHKYVSLFLAIILCAAGIKGGPNLPIRLSISELLPPDRTSVVQMHNVADHVGGVGYMVMLIGPTHNPTQYLQPLAERLMRHPGDINYLFYEKEEYALKDKALYLMPRKEFKKLRKNVSVLFNDGKSSLGLGLQSEASKKRKVKKAKEFFEELRSKTLDDRYFVSKDGQYAMLLIKPPFNSEDLKRSKQLYNHCLYSADDILPRRVPYNLVGRFADKVRDTRQIENDIAKTGIISFVGLFFVLVWGLGSFRAAYVTLGGVLLSLGWTTGIAKFTVGQINILTGFLLAILGGLGVEYGVHLIRRYEQERANGKDHQEALEFTHSHMGRALLSAAITSSAAFLILAFSDFRGFSELGIIAGAGILSIYCTYMLSFPVLGQFLRDHARFGSSRKIFGLYFASKKWLIPICIVVAVLVFGVSKTEFEYDFARMHRLSEQSTKLNNLSNELFGKSLTPAALLAKDKDQAAQVQKWLQLEQNEQVIQNALSIDTLLPDDMKYRDRQISKIRKRVNEASPQEIEEKTGVPMTQINQWLEQKPFTEKDLPPQFQSTFGPTGRVVFAFPQEGLNHADPLKRFTSVLDQARLKFEGLQIGSDAMVFMEILRHIIEDGKIVIILFLLGSFVVFWFDFKTIRGALVLEAQLVLGIIFLLGLMGLIGERFSILNVAMIPAVLAAGVDIGVHVRHRMLEGYSAIESARFVAQAVQLSVVTTLIGFGALFFAEAGILGGIAWISVLGQLAMYLVCMIIVPVLKDALIEKQK